MSSPVSAPVPPNGRSPKPGLKERRSAAGRTVWRGASGSRGIDQAGDALPRRDAAATTTLLLLLLVLLLLLLLHIFSS